ncbi:prs [Symbiodinium microadriaticum]|nr:prs [Symbiodinium microadriaticum]
MELLLSISAAKRAGAKKVTAVIPYFPFKHHRRGMPKSSKHKSKFLESVAMDFAKMLEEMGTDAVLTVDLQRPGQGQEACFFDNSIPLENIVTTKLISDYFVDTFPLKGNIVVISPNYECLNKAMKYETRFREGYPGSSVSLNALIHGGVSAHKQSTDLEELGKLEVADAHVVIVDDIVDSGETISYIANRVKAEGAKRVFVVASHGVFTDTAMATIDRSPIEKVMVTNSLPPVNSTSNKVVQVSIAPLLARAIWTEHFKSRVIDEDYLIEFH